jgi:hypothetical protein
MGRCGVHAVFVRAHPPFVNDLMRGSSSRHRFLDQLEMKGHRMKILDERAVMLAVVAPVQHPDTDYDDLLMSGVPRADARERIRAAIDNVHPVWIR